ncbi:MAG: hypothetical protein FWB90_03110 [Fibromonadales bacterium]|nr:hypothetical protein [Fibromonadales bacterium]
MRNRILKALLIAGIFVQTIISCSSVETPDVSHLDASSSSAQGYYYCVYEGLQECLVADDGGLLYSCLDNGVLSDICDYAPSLSSSDSSSDPSSSSLESSSSSSESYVYCVYKPSEMCLRVLSSLIEETCPPSMLLMDECPYGNSSSSVEVPGPIWDGLYGFKELDYDGKYYVGSVVAFDNEVGIENFKEAKCGYKSRYDSLASSRIVVADGNDPAIIGSGKKLMGEGEIVLEIFANCDGKDTVFAREYIAVVNAPAPIPSAAFAFNQTEYAALAGGKVTASANLNAITITNATAAKCDPVSAPVFRDSSIAIPGTKVAAAIAVTCRGVTTIYTAEADVIYAAPISSGTLSFSSTNYDIGDETSYAINTVSVTNVVQSGCDLKTKAIKPATISTSAAGGITAQTYYTCNGEEVAIGTPATAVVNHKKIAVPTASTGLIYSSGNAQVGVSPGTGYTLTGASATNAGNHTAFATLDANYAWTDGSTTVANIPWSIARFGVPKPVAADVVWTGEPKNGVELSPHYTLSNDVNKVEIGNYVTFVTPTSNYEWDEDDPLEILQLHWNIIDED